jgi:hypothetical protein
MDGIEDRLLDARKRLAAQTWDRGAAHGCATIEVTHLYLGTESDEMGLQIDSLVGGPCALYRLGHIIHLSWTPGLKDKILSRPGGLRNRSGGKRGNS